MTTMDWRAAAREDRAADAEQRRRDEMAREERRAARQREQDERAARLRDQARQEREQARVARQERRAERRAARAAALTPAGVYQRGTLALVAASGCAALPAQILHFVGISPMLLPVPLTVEGAAWVLTAGVAYADSRELPAWVRWLLRVLVLAAAGFAASINYGYGTHLEGLSATDARTAGIGLAAVSLLGPVLFEIRQWVMTLGAGDEDERARRKHARKRRRHHRAVARIAGRLISAARYGALEAEQAWTQAWQIHTGADTPGMTPGLYRQAVKSGAELESARAPRQPRRWGRRAPVSTPAPAAVSTPPAPVVDTPTPAPAPGVYDQERDPAVSTRTAQVSAPASPAAPAPPAEVDTPTKRLNAQEAKEAIEQAWAAGLSVREAAARATRASSYVGGVYARLTRERGTQPMRGQTTIDPSAA